MRPPSQFVFALALVTALLCGRTPPAVGQADVLTQHNDNARTGVNDRETSLTPTNVNARQFGKLFALPVDGYVYAQPLIRHGLAVPGHGTRSVLFVATEHNCVYAFDAGAAGAKAAPLWRVYLGTPVPQPDVSTQDLVPEIGITGTPVIDPRTDTLYVVAKTRDTHGRYAQRLHALDCKTGAERPGSPVTITAMAPGNGDGAENGKVPFSPRREFQRSGLSLVNGVVYIPWASHGDNGPYHGWVMGYDAGTLRQVGALNVTPDGAGGGIWMGGMGMAADAAGHLFLSTGNGTFAAGKDYGDSALRLATPGLTVADSFTPFNEGALSAADNDLGSGGLLLLPDQPGPHPHLMVAAGKEGRIYVLDRDAMGGHKADRDAVVESVPAGLRYGSYTGPAFFGGRLFYVGMGDTLRAFSPAATALSLENFDASGGFTAQGVTAQNITLNGSAKLAGTAVRLTDGTAHVAGSVWAAHPVSVGRFTTEFQFRLARPAGSPSPAGDGLTFTLQRAGTDALGTEGRDLGYTGIGTSIAIKFLLSDPDGHALNITGLSLNGAASVIDTTDLTPTGIDLHSGRLFSVTVSYDGVTLRVTVKDDTDHTRVATQSYPLDIPAFTGGPKAWAGFTGASGASGAVQDVSHWSYTSSAPDAAPAAFGLTQTDATALTFGFPGASPSVSAEGVKNGIVWVTRNTNPAAGDHGSAFDGELRAFDAADLTRELYSSALVPADAVGQYVKFSVPTVAGGRVFIGSAGHVAVFGLLSRPRAQGPTDVPSPTPITADPDAPHPYNAATS